MVSPTDTRPLIALTMGDPAGIGPELIARCLSDVELRQAARFIVYGSAAALTLAEDRCTIHGNWFQADAAAVPDSPWREDAMVLDDEQFSDVVNLAPEPSKKGGLASKKWVENAISDAMQGPSHVRHTDAIVTGPISKQAWDMAGYTWPGHTELLAARTRSKHACMVFESPCLRVALATVHVPLMTLRNLLTIGCVFNPIQQGFEACRMLGLEAPRIAVCGLNPHAGEGGILGDEETRVIAPAIAMARERGIDAHGPFPADTIFGQARDGAWDLVVAMYHDQGLIPLKLLGGGAAVNWTVGLPIIRTSPDHGTAWDIAGRACASAASMRCAIELAIRLARQRRATPLAV